jgi:hypothetical protein
VSNRKGGNDALSLSLLGTWLTSDLLTSSVSFIYFRFEEILDGEMMEDAISMSMSMSLSYRPPLTKPPTTTPSTSPSMLSSMVPSDMPSLAPSQGVSDATTDTPTGGTPTDIVSPSASPVFGTSTPTATPQVFDCNASGLSLGSATDASTTGVFMTVGYQAESTSLSTDDFVDELERQLLETAVMAALGCENDAMRRRLRQSTRHLVMDTVEVGTYI